LNAKPRSWNTRVAQSRERRRAVCQRRADSSIGLGSRAGTFGGRIGIDDFQAQRSPDEGYRTSPLRGLWTHTKGGFYHDGRFPTLQSVVDHYDSFQALGLTPAQKRDLVEFLKSL
jgi:cytochrome c peroxidase